MVVQGEEGVCRVVRLLREELELAMRLLGVTSLPHLLRQHREAPLVVPASHYLPGQHSRL